MIGCTSAKWPPVHNGSGGLTILVPRGIVSPPVTAWGRVGTMLDMEGVELGHQRCVGTVRRSSAGSVVGR